MDDLAGTQAPSGCRLTDPAESVAELERVLPGLAAHRLPTPAGVDWPRLESVLGTALPADYKLLCELYPTFELSDFMCVGGPAPGAEVAWAEDTEDLEVLAEWCEDADLAVPMRPYPAPGGLLPWSSSNQGDFFLWTTSLAGPQEWTVTVASRNGAWWHYTGGAVQFLADLVSGALAPWALPTVRPEITWIDRPGGGGSRMS
ncbi:SMI1/KNR4 family protein [Streptomyces sp. Z38]|uniref:SMI1/KNR4 family protein n=1 Tax=Streptomyces sp. Z38 TaxID=2682780 RepID=UPI00132A8EAE|nr:SMI1/KNR4 family protein [Streptomyces sp. Z38]